MSVIDPIEFGELCWPHVEFYREQMEIMYSVRDNDETYVVAGNQLGKDFVAAFIILWFFITKHPVRILTTSATERHLNILWGEMDRLVRTSEHPLKTGSGGPLLCNEKEIRKVVQGTVEKDSYIQRAVVSSDSKGEGLSGHHAKYNLFVCDEASAVANIAYVMAQGWAKTMLIFGNPNPCTNFFFNGVKAGDIRASDNSCYHRKIIQIKAEHSPHVRYAEAAIRKHKEGKMDRRDMLKAMSLILIPGVLDYKEYLKRRSLWDKVRQCIGLDAEFYEGAEVLMFPPTWLNNAEKTAKELGDKSRRAEAIGVDSAQGGDNTAWVAVDRLGLIALMSMKTPDTSVIPGKTITFMREHGMGPKDSGKVFFDAGGGGKQHVDRMRRQGYNVKAIAFGGAASTVDKFKRHRTRKERGEADEIRAVYKNRRAEMYGILMELLDPMNERGFGLPADIINAKREDGEASLRQQLAPIPKDYGSEGVLELRPKNKKNAEDTRPTLTELIGCSPDEADALVLATFGLTHKGTTRKIRAF